MFPLAPQGVGQSRLPAQPHNVHKGTEECHCWTAGDLVELHATLRSLMLKKALEGVRKLQELLNVVSEVVESRSGSVQTLVLRVKD